MIQAITPSCVVFESYNINETPIIEFPLAFPHIMLGLNQTLVFALFMVIIGVFIGTEDLGQYIMKALSDLKGGGKGLILGLCVAFIGLAVDNLIRTWAERRKQLLGLS